MSLTILDMSMATDECKTGDKGCNGIDAGVLESKCQKMESQIGAMDSKQKGIAEKKIAVFREIIDAIHRGENPINLIDPHQLEILNNAIGVIANIKTGSIDEIVEYFYDKNFKKEGSTASSASKIYSKEELTEIVKKYQGASEVDVLPAELLERLKKTLRGGNDVDKSKLPQSRKALRKALSSQKNNNSQIWNYDDLIEALKILNDKAVMARGENSERVPYDDAINIVMDVITNVLPSFPDVISHEGQGKAVSGLLVYPEILFDLPFESEHIEEELFDGLCSSFNRIIGVNRSDELLIAVLPYMGIKLPGSVMRRQYGPTNDYRESTDGVDRQENAAHSNSSSASNSNRETEQETRDYRDDSRTSQRVKEVEDYIYSVKSELVELIDYGNRVLACVERDDQYSMPNSLELLTNRCVVYAAGGEAYGRAIEIMRQFYVLINSLPSDAYTNSMMEFVQLADSNGGVSELEERRLFLHGHVKGTSGYLKRIKYEPLGLLIWAVLMVVILMLHVLF